jgi:hypothetical protein
VKRFIQPCLVTGLTLLSHLAPALEPASVATILPEDLVDFETQPVPVQELIRKALTLTEKKLTYQFGSNSPGNAGMDCSGSVQFVLKAAGVEDLAKEKGQLTRTEGVHSTDDPVFASLKPGDLLFWTGTYSAAKRDPPISHVMIFLGRLELDGHGVVFGASDGRRFRGKRITGVSVFDWKVPSAESKSKFVAFGPIPGYENLQAVTVPGEEEAKKPFKIIFDKLLNKSGG